MVLLQCVSVLLPRCVCSTHSCSSVGGLPKVTESTDQKKRKMYDAKTPMGYSATRLLIQWQQNKTALMPAPWRQGVGGEYGNAVWTLALQSAFSPQGGDCPELHLWQLALADYTVRVLLDNTTARLTPHDHNAGEQLVGAQQRQRHLLRRLRQ